jgi:signal transduction histidine kinase
LTKFKYLLFYLFFKHFSIYFSNIFLFNLILISVVNFSSWSFLTFTFFVSSSCFVEIIVSNFFFLESYYVYESTLIIEVCKKVIKIAKYMIQRKFANYMTRKQSVINERQKQIWSWIKQNKIWKKYHKKFREFKDDYSDIVSLIRQMRDFVKLKQEIVYTILIEWEFNVNRNFNFFFLYTMRAIRKCAIKYSFAKALKMTKRVVTSIKSYETRNLQIIVV